MTDPITFIYANHRGEKRLRRITPDSIEFHHHPGFGYQPGWFISGHDHDKNARRSFALARIEWDSDDLREPKVFKLCRI